jgi:hypothetical protein
MSSGFRMEGYALMPFHDFNSHSQLDCLAIQLSRNLEHSIVILRCLLDCSTVLEVLNPSIWQTRQTQTFTTC